VFENIDDEQREILLPRFRAANSETESSHKIDATVQFYDDNREEMIADHLKHGANEKCKALLSFVFMCFGMFVASVSLALTHDRLPDRKIYKPLPDILLDNIENRENLLRISEMQIIAATLLCIFLFIFHKQR
jgi:hypothetical protein